MYLYEIITHTHVSHSWSKIGLFWKKRFVAALNLINGLTRIKFERLLLMCAPFSGLPSNISIMGKVGRPSLDFYSFPNGYFLSFRVEKLGLTLVVLEGADHTMRRKTWKKVFFSHKNNTVLTKHISLFDTALVRTNTKHFNG